MLLEAYFITKQSIIFVLLRYKCTCYRQNPLKKHAVYNKRTKIRNGNIDSFCLECKESPQCKDIIIRISKICILPYNRIQTVCTRKSKQKSPKALWPLGIVSIFRSFCVQIRNSQRTSSVWRSSNPELCHNPCCANVQSLHAFPRLPA